MVFDLQKSVKAIQTRKENLRKKMSAVKAVETAIQTAEEKALIRYMNSKIAHARVLMITVFNQGDGCGDYTCTYKFPDASECLEGFSVSAKLKSLQKMYDFVLITEHSNNPASESTWTTLKCVSMTDAIAHGLEGAKSLKDITE